MSTTYLWPSWLAPSRFIWSGDPNVLAFTSPYSRTQQIEEIAGGSRQVVEMDLTPRTRHEAAAVEAFLLRLHGAYNTVALWDMRAERSAPRGTMRGSPTLSGTHAKGANTLTIQTTASATVFAGDKLGIGSQVVTVLADAQATSGGALTVSVFPRLRAQAASGTLVVWNKPCGRFRLSSSVPQVATLPGFSDGFSIQFTEDPDPALIFATPVSPQRQRGTSAAVTVPAAIQLNANNNGF